MFLATFIIKRNILVSMKITNKDLSVPKCIKQSQNSLAAKNDGACRHYVPFALDYSGCFSILLKKM
jgi:hypothetical protein